MSRYFAASQAQDHEAGALGPSSIDTRQSPQRAELRRLAALETRGYRFTKRSPWQVTLGAEAPTAAPLKHLSLEDLWVDSADAPRGEGDVVAVELPEQAQVGRLDARVTGFRDSARRRLMGLELLDVPLEQGRRIISFIDDRLADGAARPPATRAAVREPIRDAAYIREVAEAFTREKATAVIRSADLHRPHTLRALDLRGGDLVWEADDLPEELTENGAPFILEGRSLNSVFWIPVLEAQQFDDELVIKLPPEIMRVRNRWRRRVQAPRGARIRFRHPLWPDRVVIQKLHDVSYTGLGFQTNPVEDLVYPGMQIPEIEILCDGHEPIVVPGEVRTISPRRDRARICGVQLDVPTGAVAGRWLKLVNEVLHPRTRTGAAYSEPSWELFEASGYFCLSGKDQSQFLDVKDKFMDVGVKLDGAEHVGFRAVWPSSRGVEASLSFIKPYSTSWLGHQMAKRPGAPSTGERPRQVLRDIYMRAFEPVQNDPNLNWLVGYCEDSVPWMKAAHTDFAERYIDEGKGCAYDFQLMEVPCNPESFSDCGDFEVGDATEQECERLLQWIANERPAAYCESLDLVPERFALTQPRAEWSEADMQLDRQVLVARRDGRACAAMIVESAEEGTNLFHLLDSVRVFPLRRSLRGAEEDRAYQSLFRAATQWFSARGRSRFVYFLEGEFTAHTKAPAMNDLGAGRFWVLAAELLPDFLEHIHRLTAPKKAYSPSRSRRSDGS